MYTAPEPAAFDIKADLSADAFAPTQVRYIRLGAGGAWAERAFAESIIPVDFREAPHTLCASGAWDRVKAHLRSIGTKPGTATRWSNELRDFYEQDERCLWFTIANGHVYWTFAAREVIATENGQGDPQRHRRAMGGWRRSDLKGEPLTTRSLSSALLKTAAYQMTICSVEKGDYLVRRIRGEDNPLHIEAKALQAKMLELAAAMIRQLDWRDFEILVDLIFGRGGWQRSSAIGEGEVDIDLLLTMPTTREVAWVQVKSTAGQAVFDDYLGRFQRDGTCQHFFFVCHTPPARLKVPNQPGVHLWAGASLAQAALSAGLFDWLVERTR